MSDVDLTTAPQTPTTLHLYFRLECLHGRLQWHLAVESQTWPFNVNRFATKVSRIPPKKNSSRLKNITKKKNILGVFWGRGQKHSFKGDTYFLGSS